VGHDADDRRPIEIARACRALAAAAVLDGALGHISVRTADGLWVRCRGPQERGLRDSRPEDVHHLGPGRDAPLPDGYRAPNELPIHTSILGRRPDVGAVVHAHPPNALVAGLAGLPLVPLVGAYAIPVMELAEAGIPIYPRAVLINDDSLGAQLADTLGDARVCLMRGHGIVAVGADLAEAAVHALHLEALCRITVEVARVGGVPTPIAPEDRVQLPDLGRAFQVEQTYRTLLGVLDD
jgi:ribulose-5-phosphate 4-epimerase/fuculose-1-phosphate aldolase